jgi:hypothetical protein
MSNAWRASTASLERELDLWRDTGRVARLWLRDDDAHEPSGPLDQLLTRMEAFAAPCLLAVVPMKAGEALAEALYGTALARVAMHGAWHRNHAPAGRKSEETPQERGVDVIAAELTAARARLTAQFGAAAGRWYVPPWNRIGRNVAAMLPGLGFSALSTFAGLSFGLDPVLIEANTHVDIIDWKGGRVGLTPAQALERLATELAAARAEGWRPVGVLTHHLVHDADAWAALDAILDAASRHPAARWCDPDELLAESSA